MSTSMDEQDVIKLRQTLNKLAQFAALFEATEERFNVRQQTLEQKFQRFEDLVDNQVNNIYRVIKDFQDILTETGAARWRVAAESALKQGQDHLEAIRSVSQEFINSGREAFERLEKASAYAVKGVSQSLNNINLDEIKLLTESSTKHIQTSCNVTMAHIENVIKWFHWKNIGVALSLSLIITMMVGLYINDEWPWETHNQVVEERTLGEALDTAWTTLSSSDQQQIIHDEKRTVI